MKRKLILILLLCCCAASLLVTRAAASEDIDVATGDALMRVRFPSDSSKLVQFLFSESYLYDANNNSLDNVECFYLVALPVSIIGEHTYIYTLTWEERFWQIENSLSSSEYFDYIKVSRGEESVQYNIDNESTDFDGFSMYRSVSSAAGSSGYIRHVSVSFVVDDPTITNFSFYTQKHKIHQVSVSPITITDISDATLDDVLAQLVKLTTATNSSAAASASAMKDSIYELQTTLADTMSSLQEITGISMATLNDTVNKMIEEMPGAVQEGTKNAVQEFFEDLKEEAKNALSSAVTEISEAMPVDVVALQSSFNSLYNSVSTHDTSASLVFPAGSVTLLGQTFTFWEAQEVSFDDMFKLPGMTLLLLPLRFLFVFGMAKYLLFYFSKLEKLITLHVGGGG